MHSYDGPSGRRYHVSSESMDGDVVFDHFVEGVPEQVRVPMKDIVFFAAMLVRNKLAEQAEQTTDEEILGL